jgi:hypothetical protein
MGPEGGNKGGRVMFEGTPEQLLTAKNSLTSPYLRDQAALLSSTIKLGVIMFARGKPRFLRELIC